MAIAGYFPQRTFMFLKPVHLSADVTWTFKIIANPPSIFSNRFVRISKVILRRTGGTRPPQPPPWRRYWALIAQDFTMHKYNNLFAKNQSPEIQKTIIWWACWSSSLVAANDILLLSTSNMVTTTSCANHWYCFMWYTLINLLMVSNQHLENQKNMIPWPCLHHIQQMVVKFLC